MIVIYPYFSSELNILVKVSLSQPEPFSPSLHPTVIFLGVTCQSSFVLVVSSLAITHSGDFLSSYFLVFVLVDVFPKIFVAVTTTFNSPGVYSSILILFVIIVSYDASIFPVVYTSSSYL